MISFERRHGDLKRLLDECVVRRIRTAGGANKAIDYFAQAIAKDPNYALAYSGLADSYYSLARNTAALSPKEAGAKSRQAAEKAVELDPTSSEAHASMGVILMTFEWDFANAERELRRAIDCLVLVVGLVEIAAALVSRVS